MRNRWGDGGCGIEVQFVKATVLSEDLKGLAGKLGRLARHDFREGIYEISGAWEGSCADLFLRKTVQLSEELETISRDMSASAEAVRESVRELEKAEKNAAAIGRTRRY